MALTNGLIKGGNKNYYQLLVFKENNQIEELCNYTVYTNTISVKRWNVGNNLSIDSGQFQWA